MDDTITVTTASKHFSIKSCLLGGLMVGLGLRGLLMALSILFFGYVFITTGMINRTNILILIFSSLQCVLILFLAFRLSKQRWFISLGLFILLISLSFASPSINDSTERLKLESISMQPAMEPGDFFIVDKYAYGSNQPERGDIIEYNYPPGERSIKRIIGLPGESVKIEAGRVFIDGVPLQEPDNIPKAEHAGQWQVGEAEYFVMGDHRNYSADSRHMGPVPIGDILGKVTYIYLPLSRTGRVITP